MQNKPCGFLSDTKIACNLIAAHSILAVDEHPQGREPFIQGDGGIFKNSSELHRELPPALFALPTLLCLEVVVIRLFASWTHGTIRPAKLGNGVNADLLV